MNKTLSGFWIPIILAMLALSPAAAREEVAPAPEADSSDTWLIQLVLVAGSTKGPSNLNDLPQNTRAALQDIEKFLPFKSFRLWDTALVRSARQARGILTNPLGDEYSFDMSFGRENRKGKARLMFHNFELTRRRPDPKAVIRTTFAVEEGETIVVGSSRLDGGEEALLLLLTAIP